MIVDVIHVLMICPVLHNQSKQNHLAQMPALEGASARIHNVNVILDIQAGIVLKVSGFLS